MPEDPGEGEAERVGVERRRSGARPRGPGARPRATENLANGNSSFQRSSRRYDLRNMSLIGGAYCAQQITPRAGIEDDGDAEVEAAASVEDEIPGGDPVAVGSFGGRQAQVREPASTSAGRTLAGARIGG